ncbi:MAG: YggS family pyridoxal phosphate-dependent enzyme [Waterburya sp.]
MTGYISQKIASIRQEIPPNVELIAITKQVGIEEMREAYGAGIRNFGENRLPEALSKQSQLRDLVDVNWHYIGHIQKNKAKKIIENFAWIHSVDSLSLAQRMNRLAEELQLKPKVFLQVKVLPDPNKYGWEVNNLLPELEQLNQSEHLDIKGLMTILPLGLSSEEILNAFTKVADVATRIKQENYLNLPMTELSMGMSGDYQLAIQAGATKIRLGRTIFASS